MEKTPHESAFEGPEAPLVSVIVPLYNAQSHLEALFPQFEAQLFQDFEVVLVNDGSTDDTAQICRAHCEAHPQFRLVEQENGGIGPARNTGLEAVRGRWVTFVDADDAIHPRYLQALVDIVQDHHAQIGICQIEHLDAQTGVIGPSPDRFPTGVYPASFAPAKFAEDLFCAFRNWAPAKLFDRAFLDAHGLRFSPTHRTDDLPFTCAAMASANTIAIIDEDLYTYRVNDPASSTSTRASYPLDFFDSCVLLKARLEDAGLMETYAQTYTQWVGLCCMLNLMELRDVGAYNQVYRRLHDGGLAELGLAAPRTFGRALGRASASGAILDEDIDAALSIIERNGVAAGTAKLLALAARVKSR